MHFKKLALFASALLITVAFTGCTKKPRRPNPLDTVTGPAARGADQQGGDFSPEGMDGGGTFISGSDLERRDSGTEGWEARARRGVLDSVLFSFDSSSILPQERSKLDAAANYLENNPGANLLLEGHADWRGTTEYNLALGDRRAESVEQYLERLGVSSERLQTLSKGDLDATEGATPAQMARERRVELLVVDD